MKSDRQEKILAIIGRHEVETQNQLMQLLRDEGVQATQATLSRDIRDLHLVKEMGPTGIYRYVSAGREGIDRHDARLRKIFRESVLSYAPAQNIMVIKTLPGLANAAGVALDAMSIPGLVGSIAGDDTLFLAMKDNTAAEDFCREIESLL